MMKMVNCVLVLGLTGIGVFSSGEVMLRAEYCWGCTRLVALRNTERRVFGNDLDMECDGSIHSAPFGNWAFNGLG